MTWAITTAGGATYFFDPVLCGIMFVAIVGLCGYECWQEHKREIAEQERRRQARYERLAAKGIYLKGYRKH